MQYNKFFYEVDKKNAHVELWRQFRAIKMPYSQIHQEWVNYARHYNHRHWARGLSSSLNFDYQQSQGSVSNRITLNITKNIIDTIHSKITKHQPDITVLAEQHDASAEAQADYVAKFLRERFKTLNLDRLQMEVFLDACIYGTGVLKMAFNKDAEVYGHRIGEIEAKRILPYQIFLDHELVGVQDPNWVIELQFRHIRELELLYPNVRFNPEIGRSEFPNRLVATGKQREHIPVLAFYHKKTMFMPNGRFILATEDHTLEYEDFPSHRLPFYFFHYSRVPSMFWGIGLGRHLRSIQIEINKILYHISQNQNLAGRPKLWVKTGSQYAEALSNGIGIWEGDERPEWIVNNPTPPEVFNQLRFLVEQAYESCGLSQAAATGEPPPAVRSALAMEHMAERENDRFALLLINYENYKIDLAKGVLFEAVTHYKPEDERFFNCIVDSEHYEVIEFEKLNLKDMNYHIGIASANSLGHTKAGQLEFLMNLVQMGLIKDPAQLMDLMRIPNEDKTFDSVILDTKIARQENVRMSRGERIEPSEFEDQVAHIKEHIVDIKSKKFSKESPAVKKIKIDHLHAHFAIQQQTQLQQIQQAQALNQSQPQSQPQSQAQPQVQPQAQIQMQAQSQGNSSG